MSSLERGNISVPFVSPTLNPKDFEKGRVRLKRRSSNSVGFRSFPPNENGSSSSPRSGSAIQAPPKTPPLSPKLYSPPPKLYSPPPKLYSPPPNKFPTSPPIRGKLPPKPPPLRRRTPSCSPRPNNKFLSPLLDNTRSTPTTDSSQSSICSSISSPTSPLLLPLCTEFIMERVSPLETIQRDLEFLRKENQRLKEEVARRELRVERRWKKLKLRVKKENEEKKEEKEEKKIPKLKLPMRMSKQSSLGGSRFSMLLPSNSHVLIFEGKERGEGRGERGERGRGGEEEESGPTGHILVYTTPGCPHCVRALDLLKARKVEIFVVNLVNFPQMRERMVAISGGGKTVPQIFFGLEHIGGADDLFFLEEQGLLDEKLDNLFQRSAVQFPLCAELVVSKLSAIAFKTVEQGRLELFHSLVEKKKTFESEALLGIVEELKGRFGVKAKQMKLKKHRERLTSYSKSFRGSYLHYHCQSEFRLTKEVSLFLCQKMLDLNYITCLKGKKAFFNLSPKSLYGFSDRKKGNVLNIMRPLQKGTSLTKEEMNEEERKDTQDRVIAIAEKIGHSILSLRDQFVSQNGRSVDYERMRCHPLFLSYLSATTELQLLDLSVLSSIARKTFFINIYNSLVIHAAVAVGPPKNMFQRAKFFGSISYRIGDHIYSLSEIEHGILRANRKPPGLFPSKPFKSSDPRLDFALKPKEFDARIHFALVCGAKSCPPIRIFSTRQVDEALQWATEGFCQEEVTINVEKQKAKISMLFKWYRVDFGNSDAEVIRFLLRYLPENCGLKDNFKISYHPYSWDQNGRGYDEDEGQVIEELQIDSLSDASEYTSLGSSSACLSEMDVSTSHSTHSNELTARDTEDHNLSPPLVRREK